MTVQTLKSLWSDSNFSQFWKKVTKEADTLDVGAHLPRRRRAPRRLEVGNDDGNFPATPDDHYRHIYFKAIDQIVTCINDRFNEIGYQTYKHVQDLLLKAARSEDYQTQFDFVTRFYGSDFNPHLLIQVLSTSFVVEPALKTVLCDVIGFFKTLTLAKQDLLSEVCVMLRLLLVMPASNAVCGRSFSTLRRVKKYLCSTMNQDRLNHLMVLYIHRERTYTLNLIETADEFISGNEHRSTVFVHSSPLIIQGNK